MALRPATIRLSPAAAGVISRPTTRRSAASALRLVPDGSCRRARKLRLCCAPEDDEWWATPVRPEDLVEPTGHGAEEVIAIRDALVGDPLRPVSLAFQEIVATGGNIFRCRCFHAGVMSGTLLLVAGICQLYKVAPNLFMDIVLAYMFYKLSVLAAELKRNGKANNICARIQCVLMAILFYKYNNPTKDSYYHFTEFIWGITILVYSCTVYYECIGLKHPRHHLEAMFKTILTTKGGLIKVLKRLYWELIN
ncbi:hypothetical protein BDA96_03G292700 [Sorghum bicolor]|uniref:Uncharacterized protein n=2 Tax=Sorghum bicolor TaxID=4558 RepID=A0A921RH91_SORBI|nr:uncharacterized protein LOC8059153 isoform X1 [Sorghum bicolor]EES01340.1 hypothetical protein SORBI_3003G270900 [Sorghum bicolor]KAG0539092.1 hypothetical protein BDA96_03G292700 [Sorghum bicolor]|eukprot:XP_002456220.1 uncharacterized protein LOC8059153 isoform X1 [Sorghum bicolor]